MNPMMNFQPNQRNIVAGTGGNRTLSQHYLGGERGFQIIACEVIDFRKPNMHMPLITARASMHAPCNTSETSLAFSTTPRLHFRSKSLCRCPTASSPTAFPLP